MIQYDLEPEIYSHRALQLLRQEGDSGRIGLEIEPGARDVEAVGFRSVADVQIQATVAARSHRAAGNEAVVQQCGRQQQTGANTSYQQPSFAVGYSTPAQPAEREQQQRVPAQQRGDRHQRPAAHGHQRDTVETAPTSGRGSVTKSE